jgi:hypothetical protein
MHTSKSHAEPIRRKRRQTQRSKRLTAISEREIPKTLRTHISSLFESEALVQPADASLVPVTPNTSKRSRRTREFRVAEPQAQPKVTTLQRVHRFKGWACSECGRDASQVRAIREKEQKVHYLYL